MRKQALFAILTVSALLLTVIGCAPAATDTDSTTTSTTSTTSATTSATTATTKSFSIPVWEGTTTTVSIDTATQSPSKTPVRDLLSITENADGTLTDNADGTVFIDDQFDTLEGNGKKYYKMKSFIAGDGILTARQGASEAYISYRLRQTKDAAVFTLVPNGTAVGQEFKLLISADGEAWEEAPVLAYKETSAAEGMIHRINYFEFKNKTVKYIKIQFATDNPAYQLDRVRVNNVQKLNHPYEKVEDREPATFYIDAQNGSDDNDGKSPETAYKTLQKAATHFFIPGDKILLKRGCTFLGGVELQGLGLAKRRLYIGAYGKGADPVIAGGGNPALAVKMDYVTVENLEITNPNGVSALALRTNHTGAVKGIIVQNCYFHDVNNDVLLFTYSSGGIHAEVRETAAPTWLEGLVIRRNTFKDLGRNAIYTTNVWSGREGAGWGSGGNKNYIDDDNGWWPAVNMSITDNTMHNILGDAVVIIGARGLRIARNFVSNAYCVSSDDLARILNTQGTNRCAATLWSINANDVYVEHNEVGYTRMPAKGGDGEAFDIDAGHKRIFVQYNYSHHNAGGFLLICGTEGSNKLSRDFVVRFNLSIHEGGISLSNVNTPTDIYNNTFISGDAGVLCFYSNAENLCFRNNIFSGKNAGKVWIPSNYPLANLVFDNNIYTDGAELTDKVYAGRKELDGPRWGVHILPTNKAVEDIFAASDLDFPEYASNRAEAIAAYTPQINIDGAYKTPSSVDINGDPIDAPFYGCVKPKE